MTAFEDILGRPNEPVHCVDLADVSVHYWPSDASVGESCLCGARELVVDDGGDETGLEEDEEE